MQNIRLTPQQRAYNDAANDRFQQYKNEVEKLRDTPSSNGAFTLQLAAIKASYNHDIRELRLRFGITVPASPNLDEAYAS